MCGIAGFIDTSHSTPAERLADIVAGMAACLQHRGPDDQGVWVDAAAGVALGHRRLSIIDLSPEGHQPMSSADGRWVTTFNGEIYNFARLRPELESRGHTFRGHSDTEVLLAAVSEWGVEGAVDRFNGMFAIALWDRREGCLWLARDRMGEKPLYYGQLGRTFLFASELKSFRRHPDFRPSVDREALALFFRYGYVPAPHSIHTGVRKLAPGCLLTLGQDTPAAVYPYWSAREIAERGGADRLEPGVVVDELERLLTDAVALRSFADVPIGAFLSGGIDSSTIVALMQAHSSRPVRTFTIGFDDSVYDEAVYAREVARHLGTDHTELYATPKDAIEIIPRLPDIYDEPFADSSQIPTCLVSRMTRAHVTVALSGDGGDELFFGYDRYRWTNRLWNFNRLSPRRLRQALARALRKRRPQDWDRLAHRLAMAVRREEPRRFGERMQRVAGLLESDDPFELYFRLLSHWVSSPVLGAGTPTTRLTDPAERAAVSGLVEQLSHLDSITYLPDDILTKVDRASMSVSLEARIPLLDPRVVEFAWRIPPALKLRRGKGKWPLRQVLHRYVPAELVERPKMGFGMPVGAWLRGPLRDWAEDQLSERRLRSEGYLSPEAIRQAWSRHLAGQGSGDHLIWDALMFQGWLERADP